MDLRLDGQVPRRPFHRAAAKFETGFGLEKPVVVQIRSDPEARTWTGHRSDDHVLTLSERAARSALATELAVHEFAHMRRAEENHPSHTLETEEALFLAFAGREVERDALAHAYQIANHLRDLYADELTFEVTSGGKLISFIESELAAALADRPCDGPETGYRLSGESDPGLTAVNAAFALALVDRHGIDADHRLADLAGAAAADAPGIDVTVFRDRFGELESNPTEQECLRTLVDLLETYFEHRAGDDVRAAD
ncbi:MAG: DUF5781 family protein [Halodesulfurarchaeum sp.]